MGAGGARDGAPALSVSGLAKHFGNHVAFEDLSFEVGDGEVFGFLGPNGAGKTTTVRTLSTLLTPTAGSARVAGLDLTEANGVAIRQRIAVMPENPGLYDRLTVAENLACFADLYETPNPAGRATAALGAVGLSDRAQQQCGTLSKGLRQRVALARALLSDPEILFLDEPTSGLDPIAARDVHELVDQLSDAGVTIFLTTHRLEEAERLCDRVAILNRTLQAIGTPRDLRDRLFTRSLRVRTREPLSDPATTFAGCVGVEGWSEPEPACYLLTVADPDVAAPGVVRALVASDAEVLSVGESGHSLEDVYLQLVDDRERAVR